jgi:hypothetical protein
MKCEAALWLDDPCNLIASRLCKAQAEPQNLEFAPYKVAGAESLLVALAVERSSARIIRNAAVLAQENDIVQY